MMLSPARPRETRRAANVERAREVRRPDDADPFQLSGYTRRIAHVRFSRQGAFRVAGCGAAGLAGALLSAYAPLLRVRLALEGWFSFFTGGLWFGAALALYLVLTRRASLARAAGIVVLSCVAYTLAMSAATAIGLVIVFWNPPFVGVGWLVGPTGLIGGGVGGLVLASGLMFRLYSPGPSARVDRAREVCGLGGAVLGLAAATFAMPPNPPPLVFSTLKLCLVWQTGMGLLLGATSLERDPER